MLVRRRPAGPDHAVEVCFTERADGDFSVDTPAELLEQRRSMVMTGDWTWLRQVHGGRVVSVRDAGDHAGAEADASVTRTLDAPLAIQTADCVPVVLVGDGVVAAVHAGWRGVVAGVIESAVAAMEVADTSTVRALIGPCIRPGSYEFGADDLDEAVAVLDDSVRGTTDAGMPALDMAAASRVALARAGVVDIDDLGFDTADERWWSYRTRGDSGRQVTVARLVPR